MILLDGKMVSKQRKEFLKTEISQYFLTAKNQRKPKLSVILVGNDPGSEIYVRNKAKAANLVGIESDVIRLDSSTTQDQLTKVITDLNNDEQVDGILLQLPLPNQLDENLYLQMIDPNKDVDGFHFINQGKMLENLTTIYPCTPLGILNLMKHYHLVDLKTKQVSVVGTSNIVGKPVGIMLLNLGATVSFLNEDTPNLKSYTKYADIIISATGVPGLIKKDMVKKGVIIFDVGIYRDPKTNKLLGDVDIEVAKKASYYTPVPGGVGPMTVASLLENTWKLYLMHQNKK